MHGGKARLVYAYYDCTKILWESTNTVDSSFSGQWKNHGKKKFYILPVECSITPTIELKIRRTDITLAYWNDLPSRWKWTFTRQADDYCLNNFKNEKCQVWLLDIYDYPDYTGETVYQKVTCGSTSTPKFYTDFFDDTNLPYINFKDKDA